MRILNRMTVALASAATLGLSAAASAQVSYSGYTNGAFNVPAVQNGGAFQFAMLSGLTYENAVFNGTTASGFAAVGNNAGTQGAQEINNFGAFFLSAPPGSSVNYGGNTFNLLISFLTPSTGNKMYTANLQGTVTNTAGGVAVTFSNPVQTFTLTDGSIVTLTIGNVVALHDPTSASCPVATNPTITSCAPVTGFFTLTTTPEPSSIVLTATGFLGLGLGALRRRNKKSV
jgi:hypothetical protein